MRWISPLVIISLFFGFVGLAACGPAPKSDELEQLESQLRSPDAQQLRDIPNAARYFEEARQYRRVSEEARDERREERSRQYATLGLIRLQTAEAIYEKFEVAEQLQAVNAEVQAINPEIREVTQSRNELAAELRELDQQIAQAVRDRERRRREQAQASGQDFVPAGRDDGAGDAAQLREANEKIAEARELKNQALQYKADEYDRTRSLFQRADQQLESARSILEDSPRSAGAAIRQVEFALQLFEEAHDLAKPIHEEMVEKMKPRNRIDSLREDARFNYTSRFVVDETHGARVVLARLFPQGDEDFAHGTGPMLDALVDLAKEYEEFSLRIEGYTQRGGGSTQNLTISQTRAHNVQEYLVDAGVDRSRIDTDGFGQNNIRFQDSAANNDRVEVIFRHTDP